MYDLPIEVILLDFTWLELYLHEMKCAEHRAMRSLKLLLHMNS